MPSAARKSKKALRLPFRPQRTKTVPPPFRRPPHQLAHPLHVTRLPHFRRCPRALRGLIFSFNATAPPEIYTLSLHDALPIWRPSIGLFFVVKSGGGTLNATLGQSGD